MKILDVPQSGSVAGVTSSRNRYGQYRRTRAIPVNPNSQAQQLVRGRLNELSTQWRSLEQAIRDSWTSAAQSFPRTDSLGQTYYLTGAQLFISMNLLNMASGQATITAPPVSNPDFSPNILTSLVAEVAAGAWDNLTLVNVANNNDNQYLVLASAPISAGRSQPGELKQIKAYAGAMTTPLDLSAFYEAVFGVPAVGQKIFIAVAEISAGQKGPLQVISTVVVEATP